MATKTAWDCSEILINTTRTHQNPFFFLGNGGGGGGGGGEGGSVGSISVLHLGGTNVDSFIYM